MALRNTTNPVESATCAKLASVKHLFKITVTHPDLPMDAILADKWSDVLNVLREDSNFMSLAMNSFRDALDGALWTEKKDEEFEQYLWVHSEEFAKECGYTWETK